MNFTIIDLLVVITYLLFVTVVGLYFSETKNSKDFFLADKNLPWYFIMLSIVATETSSLTFLNVPGISFKTDFSFLQISIGFIFGRIIVAFYILPSYYKNNYVSVYQWIGENLGINTQKYTSSIFLITRVLADGVRLYATSIPITFLLKETIGQNFSDQEVSIATLFIITFTTVLYTVYGGFKSVVITDSIQFIVYFGGGIYALFHIYYSLTDISIQEIITRGQNSGKFIVYHGMEGSFFKSPYYFLNGVFGGLLISIGSHGVDQMFVQRLLACGNLKDSKKALIGSGIFVLFQFILFLSIGFLLYLFFNGQDIPQDKVFSKYITENIPSPILGILIAAILASAMSTLSSSINSMSLSLIIDFLKRGSEKEPSLFLSRIASVGWGFVLFLSSMMPYFLSDSITNGLVDLGLKITSFTFGPLIGLFLLAKLQKRMIYNSKELVFSLFATILLTIWLTYIFSPSLGLIIPIGFLMFCLFLAMMWIIQKVFQRRV